MLLVGLWVHRAHGHRADRKRVVMCKCMV
jgi:hypothetical protein